MKLIKDGKFEFITKKWPLHEKKITIVFIHGEGANAFFWESQINYFSNYFNVIALNLTVSNSYKSNPSSLKNYKIAINDFLKKYRLDQLIICGFSFGGALALDLIEECKHNIITTILINTAVKVKMNPLYYDLVPENYDDYIKVIYKLGLSKKIISFCNFKKIFNRNKYKVLEDFKAYEEFNFYSKCNKINIPILIISSQKNNLLSAEHSFYYKKNIKNSFLVVDYSSGHFLTLEKPDDMNLIIDKYIQLQIGTENSRSASGFSYKEY